MLTLRNPLNLFRGSHNLGQGLADLETGLLSQSQNLESLEVGQSSPPLLLGTLLGPGALLPLRIDTGLLPRSLNGTSACSTGQLAQDEGGEDALSEGDRLTGNGESVNESLQMLLVHNPNIHSVLWKVDIRACGR